MAGVDTAYASRVPQDANLSLRAFCIMLTATMVVCRGTADPLKQGPAMVFVLEIKYSCSEKSKVR